MAGTIIVGVIFLGAFGFGAYRSISSMRNNTCPGCSGGCSAQEQKKCPNNK